jgi:restriction system protein
MTLAAEKVPTYDELLWPTMRALKALGGSGSNEELLNKVIELERIPESIQSIIHSDNRSTKLAYNLAWAKTYLKRVDAITNSGRGVWSLSEAGERLTPEACLDIPGIVRRQDVARKKDKPNEVVVDKGPTVDIPTADADESWKDRLLAAIRKMSPSGFERLAQRLLREAGFIKVEVTGGSGDGGIDGVGVLRVNLLSFQVLFQCKRYLGTVGAGAVRDFRGAMIGRADKGLMITTGIFSGDAKREATRDGAPAIDLIDGDHLCDLLKDLKLGTRVEMIERVIVDPAWFETV